MRRITSVIIAVFGFHAGYLGTIALIGSAVAQQQITGSGQFCVKGPTGPIKCEFATMERCQQERPRNENERCVSRLQAEGTVGGPAREQAPNLASRAEYWN